MDTAMVLNNEISATNDCTLSDEFIAMVRERETYIQQHPDEWISAEESIKRLREITD